MNQVLKCNRCEETLRGNAYLNHWKECSKRRIVKTTSSKKKQTQYLAEWKKKRKKQKKKEINALKRTERKYKSPVHGIDTHWVYDSPKFKKLRYPILARDGFRCLACKATNVELHVDHIKPVSKHPELAFSFSNLQTLCKDCNLSKSNKYDHDLTTMKNTT